MPSENTQLQWLQSRSNMILSEVEELSTNTNDPMVSEALGKVVELMQINQQIQGIYAFHLMTALKQSEMEIDDQLNEIAGYMESVIRDRQQEAENLRKIQ